ncbi:hypothetical protein CP10743SC13_1854 [Chlamydia psittaci 10_743_SC13]|nr:hypothetical protein CP10743SC13_1854 [Chlamydia psittaci 10_743_SC13]
MTHFLPKKTIFDGNSRILISKMPFLPENHALSPQKLPF